MLRSLCSLHMVDIQMLSRCPEFCYFYNFASKIIKETNSHQPPPPRLNASPDPIMKFIMKTIKKFFENNKKNQFGIFYEIIKKFFENNKKIYYRIFIKLFLGSIKKNHYEYFYYLITLS